MLILSHPTGNQFVRALAHGAVRRNMLLRYHTAIRTGRRRLGLRRDLVQGFSVRELARLFAQRIGFWQITRHETGWASIDAVYRELDERVARSLTGAGAVYAYEDGALATFRAAREAGVHRFYDLPIAYCETVQRLLGEEAERRPDWEPTLVGTRDSRQKLERKAQELSLAELVFCPSEFVRRSLPPGTPSVVAVFGSPASHPLLNERNGPLRVLFAGSLTQRKGLADLFEAIRILHRSDVQLVVMGAAIAPMEFYRSCCPDFEYHSPRKHEAFLEVMRGCDVLALPSIVEGRALVQQEAMACGLPLLVTANAGGEDLVTEETGRLVPIRSPESIAAAIAWFADNRHLLPEMRRVAQKRAEQHTWEGYSATILDAIDGRF